MNFMADPAEQTNTPKQDPTPQQSGGGGSRGAVIGGIVLILILAAVGAFLYFSSDGTMGDGGDVNGASENGDEATGAVAIVNGEEIPRSTYDNIYAQLQTMAGGQASAEQLQQEALDTVINDELLLQAIAEANVTVDDAEVDQQIQSLVEQSGGEEAFNEQLAAANLSREELRAQVREQLQAEQFIATNVALDDIDVSEEAVTDFYDQIVAANGEAVGSLEDLRVQIEQQLVSQEQRALVQAFLDELRAEADVEILIDAN